MFRQIDSKSWQGATGLYESGSPGFDDITLAL